MGRQSHKAIERLKHIASMGESEAKQYLRNEKGGEPKGGSAGSLERVVMPPVIERWECFRIGHLNEQAADWDMLNAAEWRKRAASRGIRWQKQLANALHHERSARQRYARARAWRAYGKTLAE